MGLRIPEEEVLRRIERQIALNGSLVNTARALGVSAQLISAVLTGRRRLGPKILKGLKLKRHVQRVITFEETRA